MQAGGGLGVWWFIRWWGRLRAGTREITRRPLEKQTQVIAALTEGCSIRATERLTDVNRETIMYLGVRVGEGCARLHGAMMRDLTVNLCELDEQWAFLAKKQKRVRLDDPP